jgi:hemolysin III
MKRKAAEYDLLEEKMNIYSHGIGFIAAIFATGFLINRSILLGNNLAVWSAVIFGFSMIILYAASTLYHSSQNPVFRKRLQVFDHISIYLLIAGTYTPFALITLNDTTGWVIFAITWSMAIAGIILKLFYTGRFNLLSTIMYVVMGWNILFAINPLIENLTLTGFLWLLIGGIIYSIGAVLYMLDSVKYTHAIFHVFVLAGTICHFISIYNFVLI